MYLTQGLHRATQLRGQAASTVFGDRRQTWSGTRDRVARLAAGLLAQGLGWGDRVYVVAFNSDLYIELYYAIAWAGGVIVPGNYRWTAQEHAEALDDCGAAMLLLDDSFVHLADELSRRRQVRVIRLGEETEALIAGAAQVEDRCSRDDALMGIFYTGGTTGRPKGVMLSHANIVSNFYLANATAAYPNDPVFLHSAPMFHLADAAAMVGITLCGGTHVVIPFFDAAMTIEVIDTEQVSTVVMVPTMFGLLRKELGPDRTLNSIRIVRYGASPISEPLLRDAMRIFPRAEFQQAYGQTEVSAVATILEGRHHLDGTRLRSAGRPIFGVELRIVDADMDEVATGDVGEIAVSSPGVMLGYWNQPAATARTIVNGWLLTGDGGYVDADGFLFLVDRIKDMIVSGGENVYSAEVESALSSHPAVVECAVIGVPDEKWGERVHAIVRLHAEAQASGEAILAHARVRLAGYKCPRSIELRVDAMPLSPVGKIMKTELRKPFWSNRDRQIA